MTYTETPLRTDVSFAKSPQGCFSIKTQIQIGMVSQIPLPDIIIDGHQFKKNEYWKIHFKNKF